MPYGIMRFALADMARGGDTLLADDLDTGRDDRKIFIDMFRNEYGYLFDYVDGYMMDWVCVRT